jgi:hypothetical protein
MAYDASVHQHLSNAGEPLTPWELWYGQKLNVPSLASLGSVVKENTNLQVYAKRLRERLRLVQSYVAASEERSTLRKWKRSARSAARH